MSLLFQMFLAGRVTPHAVGAAFWELRLALGFTAEVIRHHILLKIHDKSIWQSHICCLQKLTAASGSAGSHFQLTLHALSAYLLQNKSCLEGSRTKAKTDARKSCQINGARSELHHIIWKKKSIWCHLNYLLPVIIKVKTAWKHLQTST